MARPRFLECATPARAAPRRAAAAHAVRLPACRGRGSSPDSRRPGSCGHHRTRPFPFYRERRDRGSVGAAPWLCAQGHRGADGGRHPRQGRAVGRPNLGRQYGRTRPCLCACGRGGGGNRGSAAVYVRALMAELERLANHFGDIGAICNDASFALMHAQCGILRERTLRTAEACFGHRLMMGAIVPGGITRDITPEGVPQLEALLIEVRRALPRLIELYDNTASLQDRTVTTGIVRLELARQFGAGGYVGRA